MKVYRVGGSVRDELLGRPVVDRDWVVIGATPEMMTASGYKPVGRDFPVFLHRDTAEEYALADNLCGGRLNFAIGSGFSPNEYKMFGMSMEEARDKYWETFEVILKAWTQEEFSHRGKHYQIENGSLYMKPVQKPLPPTWIAASSDETLIKAGELGFATMGIPFVRSDNLLGVKAKNDLFKESYFRAGHRQAERE